MTIHLRHNLPWIAAWLAHAATGAVWLARAELTSLRESFEVNARIMHRLLSQRASQHDAVLDTLVRQGVDPPIIMLTGHGTVEMCRRAFKSGAAEFLEKPVDDEALLETLQNAVRQHVRSRERNNADRESRDRYALLSEREREVLGLIVAGLTNKEIGRALTLSPRTVETHRANLFAKLEVESLAVLIRRFAGLVEAG